jgi:drug/metabolite transporter (DMT)-like permease
MDRPLPPPTADNYASVLALGLIWGGTFAVAEVALRGYGPITVAAARTTLGAAALVGLALALRRQFPRPEARFLAFLLPIGLLSSALPFFLLAWGQQHVSSAFAGLSMAALPLFVLPLAHFLVPGERLTWRRMAGFGLGFCGALVLIAPDLGGAARGEAAALGGLACLGASLCYAASSILTRLCPPVDPVALSALGLAVGVVPLLPAALWFEAWPAAAPAAATWAIAALGLLPTALAALLRVRVIRSAGPSFMTLVNYQVPLWALLIGAVALSEPLPGRFFGALALILGGLALGQGREMRRLLEGRRRGV